MSESNPLVATKGLCKHYAERLILDEVDFTLNSGEMRAIVGPSGSGKSTLLNILGLLERPDTGQYLLAGQDVGGLPEAKKAEYRGRDLGFIFQLHHLLPHLTVLENVLLPAYALATKPDWSAVNGRAVSLLARVGLELHAEKLPGQLSGGERQRVAVVRALINRPKLLLADEPTGALDRRNADALTELLIGLNKTENISLLVVTHDQTVAKRLGHTMRIENGKLEE